MRTDLISKELLRLITNQSIADHLTYSDKYHIHIAFNCDIDVTEGNLDEFSKFYLKPIVKAIKNKYDSKKYIPGGGYYEEKIDTPGFNICHGKYKGYLLRVCQVPDDIIRIDVGYPKNDD